MKVLDPLACSLGPVAEDVLAWRRGLGELGSGCEHVAGLSSVDMETFFSDISHLPDCYLPDSIPGTFSCRLCITFCYYKYSS